MSCGRPSCSLSNQPGTVAGTCRDSAWFQGGHPRSIHARSTLPIRGRSPRARMPELPGQHRRQPARQDRRCRPRTRRRSLSPARGSPLADFHACRRVVRERDHERIAALLAADHIRSLACSTSRPTRSRLTRDANGCIRLLSRLHARAVTAVRLAPVRRRPQDLLERATPKAV